MILAKGTRQGLKEVQGQRSRGWFGLTIVLAHHWLHGLRSLSQLIVRNLREEMVHNVRSDIMVDLVEDSIVTVNGGQAPAHVVPFLTSIPGHLFLWVRGAVVVEVGHNVEPHYEHPVGQKVEVDHGQRAQGKGACGQDTKPPHLKGIGGLHQRCLRGSEQIRLGVKVRAVLARRSVKEIKRVREKRDGEQEAAQASKEVHLAILGLCHRVPRLIVLHVAMVGCFKIFWLRADSWLERSVSA